MGRKPKIVVTNPVFDETSRRLSALGELICNPSMEPWSRRELLDHTRDAAALMAFMTDFVDDDFLGHCPSLKVVAGALKGYDNLDADACTARGIWLTVVPDLLTAPTAELAVALTLGLNRNLMMGDRFVRSGAFSGWRAQFYGLGLDGACVGIAGLGQVGIEIARRLQGFGCKLLGHDMRFDQHDALEQLQIAPVNRENLLARSDVLILALPLNSHTFHWIDSVALQALRPGARLVNVGRGSVVDEEAVAVALAMGSQDGRAEGTLAGYAADVFAFEDWARPDRPRCVSQALLDMPDRTLFTPHLGSAVTVVRKAIEMAAVDNIEAAFLGKQPPGAVNVPDTQG
jgi:phosphonate dehydrogenase